MEGKSEEKIDSTCMPATVLQAITATELCTIANYWLAYPLLTHNIKKLQAVIYSCAYLVL